MEKRLVKENNVVPCREIACKMSQLKNVVPSFYLKSPDLQVYERNHSAVKKTGAPHAKVKIGYFLKTNNPSFDVIT